MLSTKYPNVDTWNSCKINTSTDGLKGLRGKGKVEGGIKSWVKRIRAQGELESRICLNFEWSCRFSPRIELIVGIANVARHGSCCCCCCPHCCYSIQIQVQILLCLIPMPCAAHIRSMRHICISWGWPRPHKHCPLAALAALFVLSQRKQEKKKECRGILFYLANSHWNDKKKSRTKAKTKATATAKGKPSERAWKTGIFFHLGFGEWH